MTSTMIFLITYGFCGLEFVACEIADPFGDDPSDFDDLGHAQMCFEDAYVAIYKLDGERWARRLRRKVMGCMVRGSALDQFSKSYRHDWNMDEEDDAEEDVTTETSSEFVSPASSVDLNATTTTSTPGRGGAMRWKWQKRRPPSSRRQYFRFGTNR